MAFEVKERGLKSMQRWTGWLLGVTLVLAAAACGPVQSTALISEAEVAVEKAATVQSDNFAPYEYYSAKEYLYKAKEEWGYADFEAAMDYATLAKKFAEEALKKTKESPYKGSPVPRSDSDADGLE